MTQMIKSVIYGLLIVGIILVILVLFFKYQNTRRAILYILGCIIIACGTVTGIMLYKEMTAESYINGSIDISNQFSQEAFKYSSTSVVFYDDIYDDQDIYTFETELLKVENFDGSQLQGKTIKSYTVTEAKNESRNVVYQVHSIETVKSLFSYEKNENRIELKNPKEKIALWEYIQL